ncbi:putative Extracellular ligand-binding receptor [uncultured Desulfobacterium sp.]|uniref:Putative Extracellular ligand-binding receptor n=1 Tax=uncultured Desulfobacterium sp. TaxID=201089 RepID=A0A445MYN9_9BACT|nr:putative Extracellular ligand-binding receptor [uncultured Desulfobacterium sp.]
MVKADRKILFIMILTLCLIGSLSAASFGGPAKVGVLIHMTGELKELGIMQKNSLEIAQDELKGQKKDGEKITLVFQDVPMVPEKARYVVTELITKEHVSILLGGLSSVAAWEAASAAQTQKVPFLITASTEDVLTEQGWEYVFRLNPPFSEYGNGLLWFLSEVIRPKTIAMIRAKGFTGRMNASEMMEYCRKAGYEIIADNIYDDNTTNFRPLLTQIREKNPDVITMASFPNDAVLLMKQIKELDIHPLLFAGFGGGFTMPQFGEKAMDAADYVFAVSVWNPSVPYAGSKTYHEKYLSRYKSRPDFHGAEIYAGLQVAEDALARAGSSDPEAVRKALSTTDLKTIIGPVRFISYGKKTQQNRLPTYLVQWINGEMKTVWPPEFASEKYVFPFPGWKRR